MLVSDFDYQLVEDLIAKNPPTVRGTSKLLVLDKENSEIKDERYKNLPKLLNAGDLVILNKTKVIKARLRVYKNGLPKEIILLEKHNSNDDWYRHKILYRGKIKPGDELKISDCSINVNETYGDGTALVTSKISLLELSKKYGAVPLPPYIKREPVKEDESRYQTVWAKESGSVAAPTASLNMTDEILRELYNKGVNMAYITLHVGLGTFLPIRTDELEAHKMHKEYFTIPKKTLEAIRLTKQRNNKIVAVGTTVCRALEYSSRQILGNGSDKLSGEADIFIYPGYSFKIVDVLLTNFHAPKSTVLMMAAAFAGWDNLKSAYEHAKISGYKFLSYGDSMLIK